MKTYNTIYFLLFVLLIMGAFASMAQNSYGLKLLGFVGLAFGILFLYQLIRYQLRPGKKDRLLQLELVSLTVLSSIFSLRVFNIHSQVTDMLFVTAGIVLAGVYVGKMTLAYSTLKKGNHMLALLIATFYLSVIMFIIFIVAGIYSPMISRIAGIIGFVLLVIFLVTAIVKGEFLVDGVNISAFKWIIGAKDSSGLLISLFSVAAFYFALNSAGILPPLYVDDLPQAYYKLVKEANSDKETKASEATIHDQFKQEYDKFVGRNITGRD
ncbi:MAG TPA: hypothetical protein VFX73_03005 [Chitinophagaceae bacterium]|nr:hypothetical protein [Chitinophagaceae bacterium]